MKVKSESEVGQSCPTLSDPMNCSTPGFSVHGIFQARVLQWGVIAFFRRVIIHQLLGVFFLAHSPLIYNQEETFHEGSRCQNQIWAWSNPATLWPFLVKTTLKPVILETSQVATHSSLLAWRIPGTEEPGGLQFTGSRKVGHDRSNLTHIFTRPVSDSIPQEMYWSR